MATSNILFEDPVAICFIKNYIFTKIHFKDIPLEVHTFSHPLNVLESEKTYEN